MKLLKFIYCLLFSHKKYNPNALHGKSFVTLTDELGASLVEVNICRRCGNLYTDFPVF